jgi:phage-related protein
MSESSEWTIAFYTREDGTSPVEAFLDGLDHKTRARFLWSIEQLRLRNIQAREPLVTHLEGKLWELRRDSDGNTYRLLYAILSGRRIILLHGFQKKTQNVPRGEIELAEQRLSDLLRREGGEP